MFKIVSIVTIFLIIMEISAKPQQLQTTTLIPSYVVLPQMPSDFTPPPPGQSSSYNIDKIRNRRGAVNSTTFSSSSSAASSMSSSEEINSKLNKKDLSEKTSSRNIQLNDDPRKIETGNVKIQPYSAPQAQLDMPGLQPPVKYSILLNDSLAAIENKQTTTSTKATTVSLNNMKNTTQSGGN